MRQFGEHRSGGLVHPVNDSFALFDFDQVAEIPGELLGKVEIVLHVASVDKFVLKNTFQNPPVIDERVAPNKHLVVGSVAEVDALLIAVVQHLGIKNVSDVDNLAFAISRLNHNLLSIGF